MGNGDQQNASCLDYRVVLAAIQILISTGERWFGQSGSGRVSGPNGGRCTLKLIGARPFNLVDPANGQQPFLPWDRSVSGKLPATFLKCAGTVGEPAPALAGAYNANFTWWSSKAHYTPDDANSLAAAGHMQDPNNIAGSTGPMEGMPKEKFRGNFNYAILGGTSRTACCMAPSAADI